LEKTSAVNETLNCLGRTIPPNSKQSLPNNYVVPLLIRCSCKQTTDWEERDQKWKDRV
jgi:hypothetical protein